MARGPLRARSANARTRHFPAHVVPGGATAEHSRRQRRLGFGGARQRLTTVEEAGEWWLASYVATTRNAKGQRLARTRFVRYLQPFFGWAYLQDLSGDLVREYRLHLEQGQRLRASTIGHLLSDLRCLLRWAVSVGLLERSPFPPRVMPKVPELPPRGFDELDLEVLGTLDGMTGFVVRLLLGTGLRWAEACRARREHVRGAWLEVANTKSGRLRRVPLSPALLADIERCADRLCPYSEKSPGSFARRVRRCTGIEDFHVHRCRHAFAMRWLAAGGNLAVLQQILGHRDLSTTMRYARVAEDLVLREAGRVWRRLRDEETGSR